MKPKGNLKKQQKKHFVTIFYKDHKNMIRDVTLPFTKEEYDEDLTYKENLQALTTDLMENGGVWINNTIVPFHQIISIQPDKIVSRKKPPRRIKRDHGRRSPESSSSPSPDPSVAS